MGERSLGKTEEKALLISNPTPARGHKHRTSPGCASEVLTAVTLLKVDKDESWNCFCPV